MVKRNIKITHIHTATKFIDSSSIFDDDYVDNTIIAFRSFREYNGIYAGKLIELDVNSTNISKAIKLSSQADIVVVYNLDRLKSYIISRLPNHIYVVWRFFGGEFYSRNPSRYLTYLTQQYVHRKLSLWDRCPLYKLVYKSIVKPLTKPKSIGIEKVLHRVNLVVGLSREEFNTVQNDLGLSSRFLLLPKPKHSVLDFKPVMDRPQVIIGNSKSEYNNHLEILSMFLLMKSHPYSIKVLFTYGSENAYTKEVRRLVSLIPNAEIVDSHMSTIEFTRFYQESAALVLNTLRQMAAGNISTAFSQKVMVYMNPENVFYHTLISEGFIVRTIEDFQRAISGDGEIYDESIVSHNSLNLVKLANSYSTDDFMRQFLSIYRESKLGSKY